MLVFSSAKGLRRCLARGLGVSLCPLATVRDELARGELARLPWTGEALETSVLMIWHVEKWCSPLLRRFMEDVGEVMRA